MAARCKTPLFERFTVSADGCWEWTGGRDVDGYGRAWVPGLRRITRAHRAFYEVFVGPIPDGLQIDHLCRNRCCVNPGHLEPVTAQENIRRSEGIQVLNSRKTHCLRGHAYDEANTYITPDGRRDCRSCAQLRKQVA